MFTADVNSNNNKISILIVDDNKMNLALLGSKVKKLIEERNKRCELIKVEDGKNAVELIKVNSKFDIIFMDKKMIYMDGVKATRQIREWEKENNRTRTYIVSWTSDVGENGKIEAIPDTDASLDKPLSIEQLTNLLNNFMYTKEKSNQEEESLSKISQLIIS